MCHHPNPALNKMPVVPLAPPTLNSCSVFATNPLGPPYLIPWHASQPGEHPDTKCIKLPAHLRNTQLKLAQAAVKARALATACLTITLQSPVPRLMKMKK
jgi:hypothetical protein